ncbi:hypothetical protein [Verminephrobacter aporrectodeae]|uniref:hypothetical protein n=1 Tax=Verminephrobacter aporrectodeae TaxID=1110389 RepID=UPI0002E9F630|nr:hypothetical protein [Verminephrobacter aporrectodeae]
MPQSPELAGGEGFTFEGNVAAFYLTALLAEDRAPGIEDGTVVCVSLQQRDFGEPLDDVIVDFKSSAGDPARLSLQVKRTLTISGAKTNTDFREIIRDSWATFRKSDFRIRSDRYGSAVDTVTPAKERALNTICNWARASLTVENFDTRFAEGGHASSEFKEVKKAIVALLNEAKGIPCTNDEVHQFLAHFVLIRFDFLGASATNPPDAINRIRDCLAFNDADKAPLVWSRIVQLARESAGKAGQFDRAQLVRFISSVARLRGATSLRRDIDTLTELARSYANSIPDDIGGMKLARTSLLQDLDNKLATARVVQIRGLPGSGKSVVVKQALQRALDHGPILFLKAEQIEGTSWISYADLNGLSGTSLEPLLVEIGATGTPILFIDAIDRIEKKHQPVILDVIRAITESPLLANWCVVVSLRDTGMEALHIWLGALLDALKVETLDVAPLNEEEAEELADAKPHLRPLLFGQSQVEEIARRPFFAKVLDQRYRAANRGVPESPPQSEIDLIENWWRSGGYNESGQSAMERQHALLALARIRAQQPHQPIKLKQLNSVAYLADLRSDGILQDARGGISVRFAHDIFFEWAFFHVLSGCDAQWMEEIRACGEPPSVARVVELVSQWEYTRGKDWQVHLVRTEASGLRSQWLRAWLLAPLGTALFEVDEEQFARAVFADDFRLFRKVLVWFQAAKTSPNENIRTDLPQEEREQFAYFLSWPSDFAAWYRLINLILRRISDIPQRLFPEISAIFQVWQNALADHRNPASRALLLRCAIWLAAIGESSFTNGSGEQSTYWQKVPDLDTFRKDLVRRLLRSSKVEPTLARDYLQRVTNAERIQGDVFHDIVVFSPYLAQSLPQSVVELSLAFYQEELPDQQVAREEQEFDVAAKRREAAKLEAKRTHQKIAVAGISVVQANFGPLNWNRLSINDDYERPSSPSPRREPFHSLFQSSPNDALRLLKGLCNHAITAWRQLHSHLREYRHGDIPIPLERSFPWGTQIFWGTDREYLWFRAIRVPDAIGCGFLALEEWCFAELERDRPVDELIKQIVEGNECIAILGTASMLALHTRTVSETTFPLFTSQRLLAADNNRWLQDISSATMPIEFTHDTKADIEAIQAANARPVRKMELLWMLPAFVLAGGPISARTREAILNFKNDLPYQYEEQRNASKVQEHLAAQALKYAERADSENYVLCSIKEDASQHAIVHVSPSAAEPENVARAENAAKRLEQMCLWMSLLSWASTCLEKKTLSSDTFTIDRAITLAREGDSSDLFKYLNNANEDQSLDWRRDAIAATAALILNFRKGRASKDLEWARDVLKRAIRLLDAFDPMRLPVPLHDVIHAVVRGIVADLREGTAANDATRDLFVLIAHPLEAISLAALKETCTLSSGNPKLAWAALILAFSLCHVQPRSVDLDLSLHHEKSDHLPSETRAAIDAALAFYENGNGWDSLPLPPPAWERIEPGNGRRRVYERNDWDDADESIEEWDEPVFWNSKQAAKTLGSIPFDDILRSDARSALLDFIASVLNWTIEKKEPPSAIPRRRYPSTSRISERSWINALGTGLGLMAGLLPLKDFQARFLDPIFGLKDDNCWELLHPFTSIYVCAYVYDAPVVPTDAIATLDLCLDRFLQAPAFKRSLGRSVGFSGNMVFLVDILMFVSIKKRANLAARYINGNWSEVHLILPLIDRFVRAGGWTASVMDAFLKFCKQAQSNYPVKDFADQVLATIGDGPDRLNGWYGTIIPEHIAELVQYFAYRESPMDQDLAHKFLRILDILVDMGDRRSAALQLGEVFRETRLSSPRGTPSAS